MLLRRLRSFSNLTFLCAQIIAAFFCTRGFASSPLRIAMGESKPPYVSEELKSGVEYELITAPLEKAGYKLSIQYLPNKRAKSLFMKGDLDAVIDTDGEFLSDAYIAYKNMAISFCDRKLNITKIGDLTKLRVGAFHNAKRFLGQDFAALAANPVLYRELNPQELLNVNLNGDHFDVVISDINIFKFLQRKKDPNNKRSICAAALFPPTRYHLLFRNKEQRDKYNQALKTMTAENFYERLALKYHLAAPPDTPYFKP